MGTTLYSNVEEVLAEEMTSGLLNPGDQLPTEDQLMERFQVSRITVRRAVADLRSKGLLTILRGKGTFVATPQIVPELTELTGFVEDMQALGKKASARVLSKEIVPATADVCNHLKLRRGEMVVRLRRVRLADGTPLSYDETFLPLEIGRKIMKEDLQNNPIFTLLEMKHGVPLIDATYQLQAAIADGDVARALTLKEGAPILRIERTSYTSKQAPIDYELLSYRGDLVRFKTRLSRAARVEPKAAIGKAAKRV